MQGYHHSNYSHDRFPSGTGFDRYLHNDSAPRETYHLERRLSEPLPTLRPSYGLPRQSIISTISSSFDYAHTPISQSAVLRRDSSVTEPVTTLRPIVDFDPRPPHAGWTPKEEVDEEVHSRELMSSSLSGGQADLHLGYMANAVSSLLA